MRVPTDYELNLAARRAVVNLDWILDAESAGMKPDWREQALCEDRLGDWVTLPQRVGIAKARAAKANELAHCAVCPVSRPCLEYALENSEWAGIFGGKLPSERRKIKAATTEPRCGTEAGFSAHRRRREEPCSACRRARNQAQLQRKRRRREKATA